MRDDLVALFIIMYASRVNMDAKVEVVADMACQRNDPKIKQAKGNT